MDGLNNKPSGNKQTYKKYAPGAILGAVLLSMLGLQVYGQAMGRLNLDNQEPGNNSSRIAPQPTSATPTPPAVAPVPAAVPTPVPVAAEPEKTTAPVETPTVAAPPVAVVPPTVTQPPVAEARGGKNFTPTAAPSVEAPSMAVPTVAKVPVVANPQGKGTTSAEVTAPVPGIRSALERNTASTPVTASVAAATGGAGGVDTVANVGDSSKPPAPTGIEATDIKKSTTGTGEKSGDAGSETGNGSSRWEGIYSTCKVLGALGIVLGLIFIGKSLLKKIVPGSAVGSGKGVIEVLARFPLAKSQSLVLIRLGSQIVLLCQAKETSTSLLVVSDPNEVANILGQVQGHKSNSLQAGFSKLLSHASKDLENLPLDANENQLEVSEDEALPTGTQPMPRAEYSERLRANQAISVSESLEEEMDEMAAARRQLLELRRQVKNVAQKLPS